MSNHYVATQTSSALQITQQKGFSWAPVKVWLDGQGISQKGLPPASLVLDAKEYFVSTQSPLEITSVGGSGDSADGKPLSQANSFLGNVTLKDEVPLSVLFVFDIPSNESTLHTGKGQIGLEKFNLRRVHCFLSFFFFKFHLHWIYFSLTNNWFKTYTVYMNIFVNIYIYMLKCYTASTTKGIRHGAWGSDCHCPFSETNRKLHNCTSVSNSFK